MMKAATVVFVLAAGCAKSDACKRLGPRLMPNPEARWIETCQDMYDNDAAFAKTVDCLLAIDHPLYEVDIKGCPGSERLPLYFHF